MRKIKVVILLAVVILSLILLNANAEDVNEGENFCSPRTYSYPSFIINLSITAKRGYTGEATKYQFDTFEQSDILFVTSLNLTNNLNCTLINLSISFYINSSTCKDNRLCSLGPFLLNEGVKPSAEYSFKKDYYGNVQGGWGIMLDEVGTWRITKADINFGGYEYSFPFHLVGSDQFLSRGYMFKVEPKTTHENQDLIKELVDLTEALTNSSIESANTAKKAVELSEWAIILSFLAVITSVITLIVGIKQLRLGNNQLKSGDEQKKILEKQTRILDEIKDILKNSRTPKG